MSTIALSAYVISVAALLVKMLLLISIQGITRIRAGRFQYAEDAAHWRGEQEQDADIVVRAQRALRNDAENQPLFLALGASYVALGASPAGAIGYFATFVLARWAHGYFMVRPRQPHRNRAFSLGTMALVALAIHAIVEACHIH